MSWSVQQCRPSATTSRRLPSPTARCGDRKDRGDLEEFAEGRSKVDRFMLEWDLQALVARTDERFVRARTPFSSPTRIETNLLSNFE